MLQTLQCAGEDFETFYTRNFAAVYRVCFMYMKNQDDAEDCTEDVFVKLLKQPQTFQDAAHEKAWLSVTAINLCKDKLRAASRKKVISIDSVSEPAAEDRYDETLSLVLSLPEKYKDVIYLYYYLGYPTDEIAFLLHRPPSTVRSHLSEARKLLKEKLGGEFK